MARRRRNREPQRGKASNHPRLSVVRKKSKPAYRVRDRLPDPILLRPWSPPVFPTKLVLARRRVGKTSNQLNAEMAARASQPVVGKQVRLRETKPVVVGSDRLSVCAKRSQRKQVLHALKRVGRGSAAGRRRPKGEPC